MVLGAFLRLGETLIYSLATDLLASTHTALVTAKNLKDRTVVPLLLHVYWMYFLFIQPKHLS